MGRDAGGEGAGPQVAGQLRPGRNAPVLGDPVLAATLPVLGPRRGQYPVPGPGRTWSSTLASPSNTPIWEFIDGAGRAPVLAGDACRVLPLFQKAGLIEDQHAVRVSQMLHDLEAQRIPHSIGVPVGPVEPTMEAVGVASPQTSASCQLCFRSAARSQPCRDAEAR